MIDAVSFWSGVLSMLFAAGATVAVILALTREREWFARRHLHQVEIAGRNRTEDSHCTRCGQVVRVVRL